MPSDTDMTIEENKWAFKCRIEDIDVKANKRWQNEDLTCLSCNTNKIETQHHIYYANLLESSEILTYLPNYNDFLEMTFKS